VLRGLTLGQHALGFVLSRFSRHRAQLRMRMFPILHQAGAVMVLLAVYAFRDLLDRRPDRPRLQLDGIAGCRILSGALLWRWIVAAGDTLTRRSR